MDTQKYKDPRIKEYYDNLEMMKKRYPNITDLVFHIDLRDGSEPYDFNELGEFFRDEKIKRITFDMDDPKKFYRLVNETSALGQLPVEQIESITYSGNLDGFKNPIYALRGEGEELHTVPYENLQFLYFLHDEKRYGKGADLKGAIMPKKIVSATFEGIDSCESYGIDPQKSANNVYINVDRWRDEMNLAVLNKTIPVASYSSKGNNFDLSELKKVKEAFPHLWFYQSMGDGVFKDIPEVENEDLLHTIELYGIAKSKPGKLEDLKYQLVREFKQGITPEFGPAFLKNMVEFPDGTYHNTARTALFKAKDFITLVESGQLPQDKECSILINKANELSLEDATKLKQLIGNRNISVRMDEVEGDYYSGGSYTLDKFIAIQERINEMVADIDPNLDESKRASIIYERTARALTYNFEAAYPRTPEEEIYREVKSFSSRNFDGFMDGTGVCSLYALAYRSACERGGIECKMVGGPVNVLANHDAPGVYTKPSDVIKELDNGDFIAKDGHSWNQIKVNGQWYVMDSTHDKYPIERGEMPSRAFVSDLTMKRAGYILENRYESNEPCETDLQPTEVTKIFGIKDTRGRFRRTIDFIRNKPLAAARRDFYFDKNILEFSTGEKYSDAIKDIERRGVIEELPYDLARRKIAEMIKKSTTPMLPEPQQPLTIETPKTPKENNEVQSNVWDLTPEQARNVNVQEAVKQTQKSIENKALDPQIRNDEESVK